MNLISKEKLQQFKQEKEYKNKNISIVKYKYKNALIKVNYINMRNDMVIIEFKDEEDIYVRDFGYVPVTYIVDVIDSYNSEFNIKNEYDILSTRVSGIREELNSICNTDEYLYEHISLKSTNYKFNTTEGKLLYDFLTDLCAYCLNREWSKELSCRSYLNRLIHTYGYTVEMFIYGMWVDHALEQNHITTP